MQSHTVCGVSRSPYRLPSVCFGVEEDTMRPVFTASSVVTDTLMHTVLAWLLKLADGAVATAAAAGIVLRLNACDLVGSDAS